MAAVKTATYHFDLPTTFCFKLLIFPFQPVVDNLPQFCLDKEYSTKLVHTMSNNGNKNGALIKFVVPIELKEELRQLSYERNITLSSLLRLIASDYIKRNRQT